LINTFASAIPLPKFAWIATAGTVHVNEPENIGRWRYRWIDLNL